MRVRIFGRNIHSRLERPTHLGLQYSCYGHIDNLNTQDTGKFVNKFRLNNNRKKA